MRKINPRVLLIVILAMVSVCSHWYLNSNVYALNADVLAKQPTALDQSSEEEYDDESTRPVLPDVHILRKVIETSRRLIPAQ